MYDITSSINGNTYDEIVRILIRRSDSFLFNLPNMGKILINKRNAESMKEYEIGYTEEFDQDLHYAYMKRVGYYLDMIREDIITLHTDTGYLDQFSNREIEVYHVAVSEKTEDFFNQTNDFSKWMYPALPENPCFLENNKCIFQCIAHENLCFLYVEDVRIKTILKKDHVEFFESPEYDAPILE